MTIQKGENRVREFDGCFAYGGDNYRDIGCRVESDFELAKRAKKGGVDTSENVGESHGSACIGAGSQNRRHQSTVGQTRRDASDNAAKPSRLYRPI